MLRQNAVKSFTSFIESGQMDGTYEDMQISSSSMLRVVKEYTRGFQETNVNIMKSIMCLFIAICEFHGAKERLLSSTIVKDGSDAAVQKISDRKLTGTSKELLTALCVVSAPADVVLSCIHSLKGVKSPVAHEEFIVWFQCFCKEFGAAALGSSISDAILWIIEVRWLTQPFPIFSRTNELTFKLQEMGSINPKTRKEAFVLLGELFQQIGPPLMALALSLSNKSSITENLKKCFDENSYDPAMKSSNWPRKSLIFRQVSSNGQVTQNEESFSLDIPKTDLMSMLPKDVLSKLVRKAA